MQLVDTVQMGWIVIRKKRVVLDTDGEVVVDFSDANKALVYDSLADAQRTIEAHRLIALEDVFFVQIRG